MTQQNTVPFEVGTKKGHAGVHFPATQKHIASRTCEDARSTVMKLALALVVMLVSLFPSGQQQASASQTKVHDRNTEDARLKSGRVRVLPLELESPAITFQSADGLTETCEPTSSAELACSKEGKYIPSMIGAIISQAGKKFLIACVDGDSSCLRPKYGYYTVEVEGRTVRFLEWSVVTTDRRSGRTIDSAPAFFTVLARTDNLTVVPETRSNTSSSTVEAAEPKDELANLPKLWISTATGHDSSIRLEGDYLYEEASLSEASLYRMDGFCETKKNDKEWDGNCNYKITFLFNYQRDPLYCAVSTAERVTLVSSRRIEGSSQEIDFSNLPTSCPVAGSQWHAFALIPKN